MILISEECKTGPKLQQELRHVLYERFLDLPIHHIRFERNEIKNIRVFHCLDGKFTLWGRQPQFKIRYLFGQRLPLI